MLNALLWLAKIEVPAGGVDSAPVTDTEAMQNLDDKKKPAGPRPAAAAPAATSTPVAAPAPRTTRYIPAVQRAQSCG